MNFHTRNTMDIRGVIVFVSLFIATVYSEGGAEPKEFAFEEPLYEYQLNLHDNTLTAVPAEKTINLDDTLEVEFNGAHSECFSTVKEDGKVEIKRDTTKQCEDLKDQTQILLKLLAKSDNTVLSTTVLSINIVKMEFEQSLYMGTYNKATKVLSLDGIKVQNYVDEAKVETSKPAEITCTFDPENKDAITCSILNTNIQESIIEAELYVEKNEVTATTKLHISVDLIKFTSDNYVADLNIETNIDLTIPEFKINVDEVKIEVPAVYSDCLKPSIDKGMVTLAYETCNKLVTKDNDDTEIIDIIAKNKGDEEIAKTKLHLTIKKTQFKFPVYSAVYESDKKQKLSVELINYKKQGIEFTSKSSPPLDDKLKCEIPNTESPSVECTLEDVSLTEPIVTILLNAETEAGSKFTTAIKLLVKDTKETTLEFSAPLYEYDFNAETKELTTKGQIGISSETVTISVDDAEYGKCFIVERNDGKYELKRTDDECSNLLKTTEVTLKLKATENGNDANTVVALKIIKKHFEKSIYIGSNNEEDKSISLEDLKLINAENADSITATCKDADKLDCSYDQTSFSVKCKAAAEALIDATFDTIVTAANGISSVDTKVVIKVTSQPTESVLKFNKNFYSSSLNVETNVVNAIPDFTLNSELATMKVITPEYSKCFSLSNTKPTITLTYVQCEAVVKEDSIVLEVEATDGDEKARSHLQLDIVKKYFEKPIYIGSYNEDKSISLEDLKLINAENAESITATCEDADKLDCNYDKTSFSVKCKAAADALIDATFDTIVTAANGISSVDTKVVIKVTSQPTESVLKFNKNFYSSSLNVETNVVNAIPDFTLNSKLAIVKVITPVYSKCFTLLNTEPTITLKYVQCEAVLKEDSIVLEVEATDGSEKARTHLQLDIVKKHFEKSIYIGSYNEDKSITLEDLKLINAEDAGSITATCEDADNLDCSYDQTSFSVKCKAAADALIDATFDTIVTAANDISSVETKVVIKVTSQPTESVLKFNKNFYSSSLNVETKHVEDIPNFTLNSKTAKLTVLTPEYSKCFTLTYTESTITLTYVQCEAVLKEDSIVLEIEATDGSEKARTHLQLDIVKKHFEKAVYTSVYDNNEKELHLEMTLKNAESDVQFKTEPVEAEFKCKYTTSTVKCDMNNVNLPGPFKNFKLIAFTDKGSEASTDIVLAVKDTSSSSIKFLDNYYVGVIDYDSTTITKNPEIELNIIPDDVTIVGSSEFELSKTGTKVTIKLKKAANFPQDMNVVTLILKASKNKDETTVVVVYEIKHTPVTGTTVSVPNALIVREILENQNDPEILLDIYTSTENLEYGYCIKNVVPEELTDKFSHENGVVTATNLDREDAIFENKAIPQVTLNVQMMKKSDLPTNCAKRSKRSIIEIEDVKFSSTHTLINVIVLDTNDHKPVFDKDEIVIGYPNKDLINIITPAKLATVKATDKDDPEKYGKISYEILDSDSLIINKDTGDILPTEKLYSDDSKEYRIRAYNSYKERDGDDMSATLTLKVHILDSSKISYISVEKNVEEIDEYLASLSTDEYDLHMLAVGGIYEISSPISTTLEPITTTITTTTVAARLKTMREIRSINGDNEAGDGDDDDKTSVTKRLNIYVYALNKAEKTPVSNEELKTILESESIEYKEIPQISGSQTVVVEEENTDGLVAAVAVLGVLVAILLIGGIAFWYFKLRNRRH